MKNIKKCPECKSKDLIITGSLNGDIYAMTCLNCGWTKESAKFRKIELSLDELLSDFNRKDYLKTKK